MKTSEICQDDAQRRLDVRSHRDKDGHPDLNGIDYIEISPDDPRILHVHFMDKAPEDITEKNVRIEGGRRIRNIQVVEVRLCDSDDPDLADCMQVIVNKAGDFSTYTLCLIKLDDQGHPTDEPPDGFDSRYACVDFTFKANCASDLDCQSTNACPPQIKVEPEIDYQAKDYASFRQLILDRLALTMPGWQERHLPDIGITLVEILAYVGDYLSYYQDAVVTEAYLETARQRISVRRHTRLVDYQMHEGCNARTWLFVNAADDTSLDPEDVYFITDLNNIHPFSSAILTDEALRNSSASDYEVFEPLFEAAIFLSPMDIMDLGGFVTKLREAKDAVSHYLKAHFSHKTRQLLETEPLSQGLQEALVSELNRLLLQSGFYTQQRFTGVTLSDATKQLILQTQGSRDVALLNRLLLEDAYRHPQQEIADSGKIYLYFAHNEIHFYTWGAKECCLPRGATTATLDDSVPGSSSTEAKDSPGPVRNLHLRVGDVLIFEEVLGPKTGNAADADPRHRHAVRLTQVELAVDCLYNIPVVEISWGIEDALPFPLCLSTIGPPPDCELLTDISVARGNVILVDYGKRVDEDLGKVPIKTSVSKCEGEENLGDVETVAGLFRPTLQNTLLTFRELLPPDAPFFYPPQPVAGVPASLISATRLLTQDPRKAVPWIVLTGTLPDDGGTPHPKREHHHSDDDDDDETQQDQHPAPSKVITWTVQRDLLESSSEDYHFVIEMDNDGFAHLRFGDGELGRMPDAGTAFHATYRIGNGLSGNVGVGSISRIVFRKNGLSGLQPRNPFAVQGGTDPEPLAEVKLFAPHTFRTDLQRAITADDYARLAERNPKVHQATATLRWTGSRYEVLVAISQLGQEEAAQTLLDEVAASLEQYRRIGHDIKVVSAHHVPLNIAMTICVQAHFLRGHVKAALLSLFSNGIQPNGQPGFFYPDNLAFGQGIALSKLVAVAQSVQGVRSVEVTRLERFGEGPNHELENEFLPIGPREIAQLDNDPNFPEHGQLTFKMEGGR